MQLTDIAGQRRAGQMLFSAWQGGHLAHAYILLGPGIAGGLELTVALAYALACEKSTPGGGCEACRNCDQITRGIHPDFITISPDGRQITIDQVHELISWISMTPYRSSHKLAVLIEADTFNYGQQEAANALLKTLEEPPSHSILILLVANLANLPDTIVSRCQIIRLSPPDPAQLMPGFIEAGLNQVQAQTLARRSEISDDPLSLWKLLEDSREAAHVFFIAATGKNKALAGAFTLIGKEKMERETLRRIAEEMGWWVRDLCWLSINGTEDDLTNPDQVLRLKEDLERLQGRDLVQCWQAITDASRKIPQNANLRLVLDELAITLNQC